MHHCMLGANSAGDIFSSECVNLLQNKAAMLAHKAAMLAHSRCTFICCFFIQFYTYLTYNFIYFYLHCLTYLKCYIYLDVLMYVHIVYGVLPEINVFVFVFVGEGALSLSLSLLTCPKLNLEVFHIITD